MTREVMIVKEPISDPNICIKCGVGAGDRPYFVDLGVNSSMAIPNAETSRMHYVEGVIYFCSKCIESLFVEWNTKLFVFVDNEVETMNIENLNSSQTHEIQAKEIKELRKKLDETTAQLQASEQLFNETFLQKTYEKDAEENGGSPSAVDLITNLLGEAGNGTESTDQAVSTDSADSKSDDSSTEPDNSNTKDTESFGINLSSITPQ